MKILTLSAIAWLLYPALFSACKKNDLPAGLLREYGRIDTISELILVPDLDVPEIPSLDSNVTLFKIHFSQIVPDRQPRSFYIKPVASYVQSNTGRYKIIYLLPGQPLIERDSVLHDYRSWQQYRFNKSLHGKAVFEVIDTKAGRVSKKLILDSASSRARVETAFWDGKYFTLLPPAPDIADFFNRLIIKNEVLLFDEIL